MKKLLLLLILSLLSTQVLANDEEINITIGDVTINTTTPKGFYKSSEVNPVFFAFREFLSPPEGKLLAYLVSEDDYLLLKNYSDPELHTHMSITILKESEDKTLSQKWFDGLRSEVTDQLNEGLSSMSEHTKKAISQLINKVESSFTLEDEFKIEVGEPILLGIYINQPNAFGFTSMVSTSSTFYGESSSRLKVSTTTFNLIKGKLIYSYVFSTLNTTEDIHWVEEKSKELVALLNN
jgi:hypothetical protein